MLPFSQDESGDVSPDSPTKEICNCFRLFTVRKDKKMIRDGAKKLIKTLTIILVFLFSLNLTGSHVNADGWGKFGSKISWHFYENNGVLKITGKGLMPASYSRANINLYDWTSDMPWDEYKFDIKKVVIGKGITGICDMAFYDCYDLVSVSIPNTVKYIGSAFTNCSKLKSITLPDSLLTLGNFAFASCSSLKKIIIPKKIKVIPAAAFQYCENLSSVVIPNGVKTIEQGAFQGTAIKTLKIPKSVTTLGQDCFEGIKITHVSIPKNIKNMDVGIFYGCERLRYATYNTSCTLKAGLFAYCPKLRAVKLGNNVKSIDGAFYDSAKNFNIFIPKSVTYISDGSFGEFASIYGYKNSTAYYFAGKHKGIKFVNVGTQSGMNKWNKLWNSVR